MNIAMILDMAADALGDRRAIGDLTYQQVRSAARSVAARLEADGDGAATLATLLPSGTHLPAALFGAAWAGASYAPLNFRLPGPAQAELLGRLRPAVMFDKGWLDPGAADDGRPYPGEPGRPAVLLFTSGTSAAPKAAVLHHGNLAAYLFNTVEFASAGEDEGYVYITGRADDMIIRGGENISPAEIEDTLLRHPGISAAVVVGLPDTEWGAKLGAMIVPRPGTTLDTDAVRAWARERLGSIKTPEIIAVTDELPATPTGKILRRIIKHQLS